MNAGTAQVDVKRKKLRMAAAQAGIFSMSDLATRLKCSRTALYLTLERPERFSNVRRRLNRLIPSLDL